MEQESRELLIGIVAIVSLAADVDQFTLRQSLAGILLILFLIPDWNKVSSSYTQIIYALIFGCCSLLTFGFLIQELTGHIGFARKREYCYIGIWVVSATLVFLFRITSITFNKGESQ